MTRERASPRAGTPRGCRFCGYDVPAAPVVGSSDAVFCSERCRTAYESGDEPFAGRFDFKLFTPGVAALDALLPWGIPANSFVLLAGHEGIRHRGLQTELVWRALNRGERAIVMTFVDPPVAVVEHFLTFGWNVLPYLESGDLHVIDCFTNRLREDHRAPDQQVEWNAHLNGFLEETVSVVEDTTNFRAFESRLHERLKEAGMVGSGVVVIDSLNELEIQGHEQETEQFIKEVRGDVCSRNFVPVFASTTVPEDGAIAHEQTYLFDGIVDMRRTESIVPGARLKQLSVRKMDGVQYRPHWATYETTGRAGFDVYDPRTDLDSMYGYRRSTVPPARRDPLAR